MHNLVASIITCGERMFFFYFQRQFICVCVSVRVLPGFVEVFSCVGHSTGGPQPLTQRSCGHVHKLLLLLACTYKTCVLHFGSLSARAEPRTDDLHANCCSRQVQTGWKVLNEQEPDRRQQPQKRSLVPQLWERTALKPKI